MTKIKRFTQIASCFMLALLMLGIASCSPSDEGRWKWTKSEMSNFVNLKATVITEEDTTTFEVSYNSQLFKGDLTEKNVILFDITKSIEEYTSNNEDYLDYDTILKNKVEYTLLKTEEAYNGFSLEFTKTNTSSSYAVIINKEESITENYIVAIQSPIVNADGSTSTSDDIAKMTQSIINAHKSTTPEMSFQDSSQVISNIITVFAGAVLENGASLLATGGIGLAINSINLLIQQFNPSPSIQDVLDKLNTMSLQLENISSQMEKNQNQLLDDNACIKVLVDKSTLTALSTQLSNFQHNYIDKMDTINIKYNNYFNSEIVSMVNDSYQLTGYIFKAENKKWNVKEDYLITEDDDALQLTINVSEFVKAKENLKRNNNRITSGFMDALVEDFVSAARSQELPTSLSDEELKTFITYKLDERIMEKYFSANRDLAEEMEIAFIQYANALSGSGIIGESLFTTYYNRLKLMYNFMGELKPEMDSILANFLVKTDKYSRFAANACKYAGIINDGSVTKAYLNVLNSCTTMNESLAKVDDNYCFITGTKISANYVNFKYRSYYGYHSRTVAKDASYHDGFTSTCVAGNNDSFDVNSKNLLGSANTLYIVERRKILVSIGVDKSSDFIDYMYKCSVMDKDNYKVYSEIYKSNTGANKLLVEGFSTRKLNTSGSSDTDILMICTDRGVKEGKYFAVNNKYKFAGDNGEKYWYGGMTSANLFDGATGTNLGSQMLCAWAEYYQTWVLACDERWAFADSLEGTNCFVLYKG